MAPGPSAKKTQSQGNSTKMKWTHELRKKVMPLSEEPRDGISRDLGRPTLSTIRMKYMSIDETVTMFLRVVASQTPETIDGF